MISNILRFPRQI